MLCSAQTSTGISLSLTQASATSQSHGNLRKSSSYKKHLCQKVMLIFFFALNPQNFRNFMKTRGENATKFIRAYREDCGAIFLHIIASMFLLTSMILLSRLYTSEALDFRSQLKSFLLFLGIGIEPGVFIYRNSSYEVK